MKQLPPDFDWDAVSDYRSAARRVRDHLESDRLARKIGVKVTALLPKAGWVVGSHVWRPVLDMSPDMGADIDIVFASDVSRDAAAELLKKTNLYDVRKNAFGSDKFYHRGTEIAAADLWTLPAGESIVEHVLGFSQRHERVAFAVGVPVDLALTRLTHVHYDAGVPMPSAQPTAPLNIFSGVQPVRKSSPGYP